MLPHDVLPDDATSGAPATSSALADGHHRVSLVLLFNARREVLLRHVRAAGLPHGGAWTCAIEAPVPSGESYETAAAHAARDALGLRLPPALREVGDTWVDEPGARVFLSVYAAAHDGPAPSGATFVPVAEVARALVRSPEALAPELARAFRLVQDDD